MLGVQFQPGDHLWKSGGRLGGWLYDHHLIYKGEDKDGHAIIENSFRRGCVVAKVLSEERLHTFVLYERPADPEGCLQRAERALGERYHLLKNNCETFANRCVRGEGASRQVRVVTGHVALAAATLGGVATAAGVGVVTTHLVTVWVPTKGAFGFWAAMGYMTATTHLVRETHPIGVAAASGAGCFGCLWCCFAACCSGDPQKSRRRSRSSRTNSVSRSRTTSARTPREGGTPNATPPSGSYLQQVLQAEQTAEDTIARARRSRLEKMKSVRATAEEELKVFREEEERKFAGFCQKFAEDPTTRLRLATRRELKEVHADYLRNKEEAVEFVVGKVLEVPLVLSEAQRRALRRGTL